MIILDGCTNWTDLTEAKQIIKTARDINPGGLTKFQLFNAEDDKGKPHYDWVKAHELTFEQAKELFEYGKSIGQEVFFSVFGAQYVEWCEKIGVSKYKLASGVREFTILTSVLSVADEIYISSPEMDCKLPAWFYHEDLEVHLLFCPPGYPQKEYKMPTLDDTYPYGFEGLSDHTLGIDAAKIALARGAEIIEKHFVLQHNPDFPDNDWSMDEEDLMELVRFEKVCKEAL